jgi:hypothetical protein
VSQEEMPRELRLRELARAELTNYRAGKIPLGRLVDNLDTLWSQLEPSTWHDAFREHWWTLEQIYAVGLDRQELDALPDDVVTDIETAVTALEALAETGSSDSSSGSS